MSQSALVRRILNQRLRQNAMMGQGLYGEGLYGEGLVGGKPRRRPRRTTRPRKPRMPKGYGLVGGKRPLSQYNIFFAQKRRQGYTAAQIGDMWRSMGASSRCY